MQQWVENNEGNEEGELGKDAVEDNQWTARPEQGPQLKRWTKVLRSGGFGIFRWDSPGKASFRFRPLSHVQVCYVIKGRAVAVAHPGTLVLFHQLSYVVATTLRWPRATFGTGHHDSDILPHALVNILSEHNSCILMNKKIRQHVPVEEVKSRRYDGNHVTGVYRGHFFEDSQGDEYGRYQTRIRDLLSPALTGQANMPWRMRGVRTVGKDVARAMKMVARRRLQTKIASVRLVRFGGCHGAKETQLTGCTKCVMFDECDWRKLFIAF
ncbi:hypothetical protein BDZ97DRAFT_2053486 [Flammula alnicola]|nr:hypothetical protein BDZ97DRAFT_2053486 [Flammula alnicola]